MVIQSTTVNKKHQQPKRWVSLQIAEPNDLLVPAPPYQVVSLDALHIVARGLWNFCVVTTNYNLVCLDTCTPLLGHPLVTSQSIKDCVQPRRQILSRYPGRVMESTRGLYEDMRLSGFWCGVRI